VAIDQHIDLTGPFGAFIAKQFVLFSEFELALIRQRTSNALQQKRRTGLRNTHSLFGYDAVDGQWIPNDDEQATIRRIHELHAAGHTDSTITRQFNTDGTPAKRGGRWQANTVHRIRTRELQLQSV
jgi:DNA invertase Pin-like site-specific DNA recombinase